MLEQVVPNPKAAPNRLRPPTVAALDRFLYLTIGSLILAHLVADWAVAVGSPIRPLRLSQALSLNAEQGVGTWYASVQLSAAALLAAAIARTERAAGWWWFLAAVLLAASIEEVLGFHEYLSHALGGTALREQIRYTWVIAGAPAGALLGLVFIGFIRRQAPVLRNRLLAGGSCFVLGAVAMELLGGIHVARAGMDVGYVLVVAMEEGLELIGGALVLSGLYRSLCAHMPDGVAESRATG